MFFVSLLNKNECQEIFFREKSGFCSSTCEPTQYGNGEGNGNFCLIIFLTHGILEHLFIALLVSKAVIIISYDVSQNVSIVQLESVPFYSMFMYV